MSSAERLKVLLFLALFSGAVGFLFTLLSCGTEYWLLALESCSSSDDRNGAVDETRIFHEGLFWRCSFTAAAQENFLWDLWSFTQPTPEVCQAAFLFPFPLSEPRWPRLEQHSLSTQPYEHHSAIVYRTFWSIFLIAGVTSVFAGGPVMLCAAPLSSRRLYRVSGGLHLCGSLCLLTVLGMYVMWVQVLDTLEQFALHQRGLSCPSFHLSVQHGPSFLLAPVAVFFCLLAGLLLILTGRCVHDIELEKRNKAVEVLAPDVDL